MDMQRRQYENMNPHRVGKKSLRDQCRGITDFQRYQATLVDHNPDAPQPYSMRQYEHGVPTSSERKQWDDSWQRAPKSKMYGRGGSGSSWDQWEAAKYGDDQWDDCVKESVPPQEIGRIKNIVNTFSVRGSTWHRESIYKHLKTNSIDTNGKVNIALEHLETIENQFFNYNQYVFTKEALQRIKDEIKN